MSNVIHAFGERAGYTESPAVRAFWGAVYARAFPDLAAAVVTPRGAPSQAVGIDVVLALAGGRTLLVDEKTREGRFGDVLLEVVSNDQSGAPGWIEKPLLIDYLAYGLPDAGIAYLFAWEDLRRAWRENQATWRELASASAEGFRWVKARNPRYTTVSIAVPEVRLRKAMARSQKLDGLSPEAAE